MSGVYSTRHLTPQKHPPRTLKTLRSQKALTAFHSKMLETPDRALNFQTEASAERTGNPQESAPYDPPKAPVEAEAKKSRPESLPQTFIYGKSLNQMKSCQHFGYFGEE